MESPAAGGRGICSALGPGTSITELQGNGYSAGGYRGTFRIRVHRLSSAEGSWIDQNAGDQGFPAGKEYHTITSGPNQLGQTNASYFFIGGFYT
jgi:hypothetical protein